MFKKLLIGLAALVVGVVAAALLKSPEFRVERSRVIDASADRIFPFVTHPRRFNEWNPWVKMDPEATYTFSGEEEGAGAVVEWDGAKVGKGSATITDVRPNERIVQRMVWIEPMEGTSTVEFTFKPEGEGQTKVTWAMYGRNDRLTSKLIGLFINCESMCGPEFEKGLDSLAELVTSNTQP